MMSSTMQYKAHEGDRDAVETSLSLLKAMRDDGNMPAHNYYDQLLQLKFDLDHAVEQIDTNSEAIQSDSDQSNGLQMLLAASGSDIGTEARTTAGVLGEGQTFGAFGNYDTSEVLNDPYIQNFLNQQQPYAHCMTDDIPSFPNGDLDGQFEFDFLDMNVLGNF